MYASKKMHPMRRAQSRCAGMPEQSIRGDTVPKKAKAFDGPFFTYMVFTPTSTHQSPEVLKNVSASVSTLSGRDPSTCARPLAQMGKSDADQMRRDALQAGLSRAVLLEAHACYSCMRQSQLTRRGHLLLDDPHSSRHRR